MGGCSTTLDIDSAEAGRIVSSRPKSTIGPMPLGPTRWREVHLDIQDFKLGRIERRELTVRVRYTNCEGQEVDLDEIYLNEISLNQIWLGEVDLENLKGPASSYVMEDRFELADRMCLEIGGGNMLRQRLSSNRVVLK